MGKYYKDAEQLFNVYKAFFQSITSDEAIGKRLARCGSIIWFEVTDPAYEFTLDFKNEPAEGAFGAYFLGPCTLEPDIGISCHSDYFHRFWHGLENPYSAVASGKIKFKGSVTSLIRLVPVIKPAFTQFPKVLKNLNLNSMIIKMK